jgi:CRP/FNR family cyclic AMP-dependent transcriptional regulator
VTRKHPPVDERLKEIPLFAGLSKDHLREVSNLATRIDRPAGSVLAKEGHTGNELIIVHEGEVEVRKGDDVVTTRGPGSYLGEIALLEDRPRTASLVTKTPVVIDVIGRREFTTLLHDMPELGEAMKSTMTERLTELNESGEHH